MDNNGGEMNIKEEVNIDDGAKDEKSFGPMVGIIIIVIILILGGLYFWGQKVNDGVFLDDSVSDALEVQGESDAISDIEEDLNATELDTLTEDLGSIEKELGL